MKRKLVMSLVMSLVMVGCAYNLNYVNSTYKLLSVAQTSYETAIQTVIDLNRQGRVSDEQKATIFAVGKQYAVAHNAAVEALAQYEEDKLLVGDERLNACIETATEALSTLLELVKPYLLEVE